jgi:two-component system cell cycle sensor histidine kinase/response regulator CckA
MHSLLRRQLERQGLRADAAPEEWRRLLEAIDKAYREFDDDRAMVERSLELSSQELLQANSDMRALFQALPDLLFRLDSKGTILEHKGSSESDLFVPAAKLVGRRIEEIPLPELARRFTEARSELQATGRPVQLEFSLTLRGAEQFFEARLVPALGDQSLAIVRNITARRRSEVELHQAQQMIRLVLDNIPQRVFWKDRSLRYLGCNLPFARDAGLSAPEEILGRDDFAMSWRANAESYRADDRAVMESGRPKVDFVEPQDHPDGTRMWLRTSKVPLLDRRSQVIGVLGTYQDITEQRRSEEALRESEERYRQLVQNAPLGILVADPSGRITLANGTLVAILGSPSAEATQAINLATFPPLVEAGIAGDFRRCLERGESFVTRRPYRSKWGKSVELRLHVAPLRGPGGTVEAVQVLVEDFTAMRLAELERAQLEDQLRQAMKMEAIGRLAGGVAHDFNNILTAISGNAEFMLSELEPGHPCYPDVLEIKKAAGRAASLTAQLLAFSRKQVIAPRVLDLNQLVAESAAMLRRLIGEDVSFEFAAAAEPCPVRADPGQLEQVLINLAVNARDAMPDGGRLAVTTAVLELDEEFCRGHAGAVPGRFVRLSVRDAGSGMDENTREHLFEPFFTTKERGRGTGLGLSQVYGIVMQNQGLITVYSAPDSGTEFQIYLPAVEGSVERDAPRPRKSRPPSGAERVLLVEDEAAVRQLATRVLRMQGYQVTEASSAEEALRTLEGAPGSIDLLVTDVIMPGMNGRELHRRLSEARPGLRVVFMSGYSWDVVTRRGVLEEGTHFLDKPFTVDALARKVREALDA